MTDHTRPGADPAGTDDDLSGIPHAPEGRHTAGAFDIRNFIGALIGIYGVILVLMGIFADPALDKTGGVNANLWTGIVMLVVAAVFMTWARLRPIVVPEDVDRPDDDATRPAPKRRAGGH